MGYLQETAAPIGFVSCFLWRRKSPRVHAHVCQFHSAQKNGKNPKAKSQSYIWIRHFKSNPFPIPLYLPEPLRADEQRSLCVKLIKFRREVRLGALVRDASAGVRRKQPRNSFHLLWTTGLRKSRQPKTPQQRFWASRKGDLWVWSTWSAEEGKKL